MIKRIKITDFKSIRELDLTLDPVTVIVGRSGTGKSNFVQAIRFLRNLLLNPEQAANYEWGWDRILPAGENKPRTAIEVMFSIPSSDLDYVYDLSFGSHPHGGNVLTSESLRVGDEVVFSRTTEPRESPWTWVKAPRIANLPSHDDKPMLGAFPSLTKAVDAHVALSNGIGYYHFPATALAWRREALPAHLEFLKAIPGLSDDASNYLEILLRITQDFHRPELRKSLLASLKEVNPSIASIQLDSLTKPSKAIVAHEAGGQLFELSLEQESDGFRRFYAHLLALYQTPPKLTLIFEEPENAIFPGALSLLADEFKAAPRENRGQVIITTHSPMLLDSFDVDNVRVVEMENGKTVIGRVSKEQREAVKSRLLTTGELLTVDQAKIESARAV